MTKPACVHVFYIATTPELLWAALTQGRFTQQYWYGRRVESDWTPGVPIQFYDRETDVVTDKGVVLEYDRPRKLAYTFQVEFDAQAKKLGESRVTFLLDEVDELVKLTLVHDELPSQQVADGFREGWAPILSSLKTFMETGRPLAEVPLGHRRGDYSVSNETPAGT